MKEKGKKLHWFESLSDEEKRNEKARRERDGGKGRTAREAVNLEKHVDEVYLWIEETAHFLNIGEHKEWAYSALRAVLHALRDRLMPQEMFQLSAQLPLFIRGIYFEGHHFSPKPEKMNVHRFLDRISEEMNAALEAEISPSDAFRAVLLVLYTHVSEGELKDIYGNMPADIKQLWHNSRGG